MSITNTINDTISFAGALKKKISHGTQEVIRAAKVLESEEAKAFIENVSCLIAKAYLASKKVLICGNGGSLCDAMHFAEELTGQFRHYRRALPAIALSDPAHLTCVGNDFGYEEIFSRGIEALGSEGDVLIVLSTSGKSGNILKALSVAKEKKMSTVAFLGKDGGKALGTADLEWVVSGFSYSDRIQEAHMAALHLIVELVEAILFEFQNPN